MDRWRYLCSYVVQRYSYTSQAVSELTAIGAPTRSTLFIVIGICEVLVIAFGVGLWLTAVRRRGLRLTAIVLIISAIVQLIAIAWAPYFSMNMRGAEITISDLIHIVLGMVTVLSMLLGVGFGLNSLGKPFRTYSIFTILIITAGAVMTSIDGTRLAANLPTPWLGIKERIFVYSFMLWVIVLAISLLGSSYGSGNNSQAPPP